MGRSLLPALKCQSSERPRPFTLFFGGTSFSRPVCEYSPQSAAGDRSERRPGAVACLPLRSAASRPAGIAASVIKPPQLHRACCEAARPAPEFPSQSGEDSASMENIDGAGGP
jgi:hypothetical protein